MIISILTNAYMNYIYGHNLPAIRFYRNDLPLYWIWPIQ